MQFAMDELGFYLNCNFEYKDSHERSTAGPCRHAVADHFAEMRNMVGIGSGAQDVVVKELQLLKLNDSAKHTTVQPPNGSFWMN